MRLKKLKIHGFKSFADRVSLEFHPGITGIVGPNGCGKSNIADAFRWVLGETSAKSLRGKKMEDVIFAGTTSRKPIGLAEVSLTLTDVQGFLPTEYDELEITRRCYRSGETEFLINRQVVRMKDVVNLFLDSGMGKHAFSIFEQGNIDEIIQKSPKERRTVFEEAAGILRFFERRKEAEKKLELSETNISRVQDICKEIEKHVTLLETQAKEAESFQKKKESLEELEKNLAVFKFQGLVKEKEKLASQTSKKEEEILSVENASQEMVSEVSSLKELIDGKSRAFQEMNEALFQARSEKEAKLREQESNTERMKESVNKLANFEKQRESLEDTQENGYKELKALEEKTLITKKKESEKKAELLRGKEALSALEKQVADSQSAESLLKEEKMQLIRVEKESEGEIREVKARLESAREKKKKSELEKSSKKKIQEELDTKQNAQKALVQELSFAVDEKKEILDAYEKEEVALKEKGQVLEKRFEELERDYVHAEARERSLMRLRVEMEGASPGFKRLVKECASEKSPLYGKLKPLFEMIKPKGPSKMLLLQALKPYSETFVAHDDDIFGKALEFSKNEDVSLFSLTSLKNPQGNTLEERLTAYFLKNWTEAKTIKEALNLATDKFVSVEEGFVDPQLIYTRKKGESNPFLRESEIEELKISLNKIDDERKKVQESLNKIKGQKAELWQRKIEADKDLKRSEMRQLESNFLLQKIAGDLSAVTKDLEKLLSEEELVTRELSQLESTLQRLETLNIEKKKALESLETKGHEIFSRHEQTKLQFESKKAIVNKLQQETEELSFSVVRLEGEIKVLNTKIQESAREMVRIMTEISHLAEWKEKCKLKSMTFEEALVRAEATLAKTLQENKALESNIHSQKTALAELEEKLKQKSILINTLKEQLTKLQIKEAEIEVGIRTERENYEFEGSLEEQPEIPSTFNGADSDRKAKALRKEIEEMEGRINMMSIEDLRKESERRTYLQSQVNDMQLSKSEIMEIIASLDKESRTLFEDTFKKIRENFQKNFKVLFGEGGEADLEFVDSEDVLQAGIEIVAKPPGKKMRSINLLSGGEKCLTSMALLFSIFEIKPAPFCILDEIDAPLDDTNVERFLNVVRTFVDRCQFIIITHNKRTMAIADRLFGVSMEERGVSKLLSIEFSEKPAFEHC